MCNQIIIILREYQSNTYLQNWYGFSIRYYCNEGLNEKNQPIVKYSYLGLIKKDDRMESNALNTEEL